MDIHKDFAQIMNYAHMWNWLPDWQVVQDIYQKFPESYSVLTPFAYAYLEELIRSMTSEYGREFVDALGNPRRRRVGNSLIELAIKENHTNSNLVSLLEKMKSYFTMSTPFDVGDNRNSVLHGYMHAGYWDKESFENLVHDIALLSQYADF